MSWRPWEQATGPRSVAGKARSSRNADRGGLRPKWRATLKILDGGLRAQCEWLEELTRPSRLDEGMETPRASSRLQSAPGNRLRDRLTVNSIPR